MNGKNRLASRLLAGCAYLAFSLCIAWPAGSTSRVYAEQAPPRSALTDTAQAKDEAWRTVQVTRKEEEVKGMRHIEDYDVTLSAPSKSSRRAKSEELEAGAIIQLQRRAVEKRATHLLIKEVKFMTAYGEPPSVRVVAQSYRKLKTQ